MTAKTMYSYRDCVLRKREEFEDILQERRNSSDLRYALRCYTPVLYKELAPCKASELKSLVMHSDQLRYVINQVSVETGESADTLRDDAAAILEEMAHRLQLGTVRFLAFLLTKALKSLFKSICVNEDGLQRLQQAVQEHPVVLLPSHRSYMDFLLMSYILFTYDISLPVIAAGMDFMGMKIVGEMLRMSGAFFIRRSFAGDRLYWAVFSEYVKTILRNGLAPVEFFLEGTRSRTCKSLTPKLGLLNIVMEPFFKGEVFDISLVPVSISYERVLEETLYARELLGVPKPKETTSGLFKARKILSEDYGSIHVYFGQPVSLRGLAQGRVDRSQYSLTPRHVPRRPNAETQVFVNSTAYRLLRVQEEGMVLQPWVLLASLLLQCHGPPPGAATPSMPLGGLPFEVLTERAVWLRGLCWEYGAVLHWTDHMCPSEVVSSSLELHQGLVRVSDGHVRLTSGGPGPGQPADGGCCYGDSVSPEEQLFSQAVVVLSCASYRNQVLHVFLRPALLATALLISATRRREEVYNSFSFLRNMFSNEFILCPGESVQDFEEACYLLGKTGELQVSQNELLVTDRGQQTLVFLTAMLDPFMQGYQVVCRFLCEEATQSLTEKLFVPTVRSFAVKLMLAGSLQHYEVLSSDLQKNALAALMRMGAVRQVKGADQVTLKVNKKMVNSLEDTLGGKLPTPKAVVARL